MRDLSIICRLIIGLGLAEIVTHRSSLWRMIIVGAALFAFIWANTLGVGEKADLGEPSFRVTEKGAA